MFSYIVPKLAPQHPRSASMQKLKDTMSSADLYGMYLVDSETYDCKGPQIEYMEAFPGDIRVVRNFATNTIMRDL
jgi:hypothetical protein